MSNPPKYVLYHSPCPDGFGAAFAAWMEFGDDAEYIPVKYGENPPLIEEGAEVFIVDFSYKRPILEGMSKRCKFLWVLDHHKTAEEELKGVKLQRGKVFFNMDKSGAVMAWEFFHNRDVPELLLYVQDRDLWRFEKAHSKEYNAALASYPKDFNTWLALTCDNDLVTEGEAILRAQGRVIGGTCKEARLEWIGGHKVPVVNCTAHMSEVGHELLHLYPDAPFSASYRETGQRMREWSLRSRGNFDVSEVARSFGGGGHKAASGFREQMIEDA